MKLKYNLSKFEKALVFQVLEMDERFRSKLDDEGISFRTKNGMWVRSVCNPVIDKGEIFLQGQTTELDGQVTIKHFDTNKQRDKFFDQMQGALADWAENWEGFRESKKAAFWSKKRPKDSGYDDDCTDPEIRYVSPEVPDCDYGSVVCWGPKVPCYPEEKQPGEGTFVLE